MTRLPRTLVASIAAAGLVTTGASAAFAKSGKGNGKTFGTCSAGSEIKAKNKAQNAQREVEFEVDQNRVGISWDWTIARGGATLASGTSVTLAPSGSFSVNRLVAAGAPVTITATRAGESCTVTV